MESELIAIGLVLLVVAAVLMVAVGAQPSQLDMHIAAVRVESQAQAVVTQLAERLPR